MKQFKAVFEIVEQSNCPLYVIGERLVLTDRAIACPKNKEVCLILVREMTELLFVLLKDRTNKGQGTQVNRLYTCSGCSGLIKFRHLQLPSPALSGEGALAQLGSAANLLYGRMLDSPFLRALPDAVHSSFFEACREVVIEERGILIHKGEPNHNLYIILEGALLVEDAQVIIATLGEGEICGEMSYLGSGVAGSTVRAKTEAVVLAIHGDDFSRLLGKTASVQIFMAQLLASRLQKTNAARAREFESCMSGKIDEVVPAELFQIFHMHQKTGVLTFYLQAGEGKVSFREGCIINAHYGEKVHQDAIFAILAEKKGAYRFTAGLTPQEMKAAEIGDFMMLLMEGVKRIDEEQTI
jgi:CRP/FNR family transcriptional regulator, cyclic AMP receptor protein